ncbi:MAG TPA: hypothetical protein VML54_06705 [Candidatus Limnocylindrales bacterium]|nr:hypothetical protein [Candidatus Limnocylindrales bacterium]
MLLPGVLATRTARRPIPSPSSGSRPRQSWIANRQEARRRSSRDAGPRHIIENVAPGQIVTFRVEFPLGSGQRIVNVRMPRP